MYILKTIKNILNVLVSLGLLGRFSFLYASISVSGSLIGCF